MTVRYPGGVFLAADQDFRREMAATDHPFDFWQREWPERDVRVAAEVKPQRLALQRRIPAKPGHVHFGFYSTIRAAPD